MHECNATHVTGGESKFENRNNKKGLKSILKIYKTPLTPC